MFVLSTLAAALVALSASSPALASSCPTGKVAACCQFQAPFSSNEYVWGGICGLHVPPTTNIGSRCTTSSACSSPQTALCCDSLHTCGDSPLCVNATPALP